MLLAAGAIGAPLCRAAVTYHIETVAGTDDVGDNGPALSASLGAVEGLALDASGNLFLSDNLDHRIRRVDNRTGRIDTVVGNGHPGMSGDGGRAADAQLHHPYGVAIGPDGAIFVADYGNCRVRRISPDGFIGTVAGGGGDSPARRLPLLGPRNVAVDRQGNLYISDFDGQRIYRVTPTGNADAIAGTGIAGFNGDGHAATTHVNGPAGLALAHDGSLYFADAGNRRIRRVAGGEITTVLGERAEELELFQPTGVAIDDAGALYLADSAMLQIYRKWPLGEVSPILPEIAGLDAVRDIAVQWWPYFGGGRRVYVMGSAGQVAPIAGNGEYGLYGDGVPATSVWLDAPIGVALDALGNLLIAEEGRRRLRRIDAQGIISTVADGKSMDDGSSSPTLIDPVAVTTDRAGRIWIADHSGNRVYRMDFAGAMHAVAGDGAAGFGGDSGPAYRAQLNRPRGLASDGYGNVYISDSRNHRIRRIAPDGTIHTYAGSGVRGYSGDRGLATRASLHTPAGIAAAQDGTLFVADAGNHAIRQVRPDGIILTLAGVGLPGFGGDGGHASAARLNSPSAVAVDELGFVWVADTGNHRIRRISPEGVIETVAGAGMEGFTGDGGPAKEALLSSPSGLAIAADGGVWIADLGNRRVRRLTPVIEIPVIEPPGECSAVNAATFLSGPLAPGQIASLFGAGMGPDEPVAGVVDENGSIATVLGGVEVRFNGIPAPLFFAAPDQINLQVPYGLAGLDAATVEVFRDGSLRSAGKTEIAEAAPGLFMIGADAGHVAAVHEDGSINTPDNRAPRGSVVMLFATGEGKTDPPGVEGRPAASPLPKPMLPVHARIGGLPAEILYAGAAPGYAGLMQVNVRIPDGFAPSGELLVELYVGGARSQPGARIWVR